MNISEMVENLPTGERQKVWFMNQVEATALLEEYVCLRTGEKIKVVITPGKVEK